MKSWLQLLKSPLNFADATSAMYTYVCIWDEQIILCKNPSLSKTITTAMPIFNNPLLEKSYCTIAQKYAHPPN